MRSFFLSSIAIVFLLIVGHFSPAVAVDSKPHIILNFAQMNELDWAAPEEKWKSEVKPKIVSQILAMRSTLEQMQKGETKAQDDQDASGQNSTPLPLYPTLGWSTLMEYMNFPMDKPSPDSVYALKTRRILDLAEELDFPVFLPLNGYQWWDELPELYNYWDLDGTQTDPKFFSRQDDPVDFKKRFIAGYNPENKWNVEWQDRNTPMKLNYRNWGGGGFRLAPPPNLVENSKAPISYRSVQTERLKVIVTEIQKKVTEWKSENKDYLFVGLSIGTEINLNASVTAKDEFQPYGYRSMQDIGCSDSPAACRVEVVRSYIEDNAKLITKLGIPKGKIYSHVLGEQNPGDAHYGPYADSSFNLYSNPGSSFYGFAQNPLQSKQWSAMLEKFGSPQWGALEYTSDVTVTGLRNTVQAATVTLIYNWDGIAPKSIRPIQTVLASPITDNPCIAEKTVTHTQRGIRARIHGQEFDPPEAQQLPHGIYTRFTKTYCQNGKIEYSQPEVISVPIVIAPDTTPKWVHILLDLGL